MRPPLAGYAVMQRTESNMQRMEAEAFAHPLDVADKELPSTFFPREV